MFYSDQYIKISVKPYPQIDYFFTEAHIYLLYENLLPGHFIISPLGELPTFCNIELKSSNNNSQIPLSTPISTTSPSRGSSSNTQDLLQNLHLNIVTYNVRGFNIASKRQIWQDYCINYNISIACITETKISSKTKLSFCNNNLFTYYWANSESSIEGTAIMIRNHLKPHVHSCHTYSGGAIALNLFFKSGKALYYISLLFDY